MNLENVGSAGHGSCRVGDRTRGSTSGSDPPRLPRPSPQPGSGQSVGAAHVRTEPDSLERCVGGPGWAGHRRLHADPPLGRAHRPRRHYAPVARIPRLPLPGGPPPPPGTHRALPAAAGAHRPPGSRRVPPGLRGNGALRGHRDDQHLPLARRGRRSPDLRGQRRRHVQPSPRPGPHPGRPGLPGAGVGGSHWYCRVLWM